MDLRKSGSSLFFVTPPLPLFYSLSQCFQKASFWLRFLIINAAIQIFSVVLIVVAHTASSIETCYDEPRNVDEIHSDIRMTNDAVAALISRAFAEGDTQTTVTL